MSDHDRVVDSYIERQRRNIESRKWAHRNGEPWTDDEDELLLTDWIEVDPDHRDERLVSQVLERTIESCRVRCERIRADLGINNVIVVTTTTTTTTNTYIGINDDPEDRIWSPDYYTK